MKNFASLARKVAKKSSNSHFQHAALIIKSGRVLAWATNDGTKHAEEIAMNQRKWRGDLAGATLISIRLKKSGGFGLARPCIWCSERAKTEGISDIYYSDKLGGMVLCPIKG